MKNTTAMTVLVSMPTTRETSSSSPMARTDLPKAVLLRSNNSPPKAATDTAMVNRLKPLILAPPMVQGSLPKAAGKGRGAAWKTMVIAAEMASRIPRDATSIISGERDRSRINA